MIGRYVDTNEGTETPSNLIFFDTESYSEVNPQDKRKRHLSLRLWCATYVRLVKGKVTRRNEAWGEDAKSFWQFVFTNASERHCTWVFAHNLCFDLTQVEVWKMLDDRELITDPLYRKNPDGTDSKNPSWIGKLCLDLMPFFLQVRKGLCTFKFVDTCNYWPKSLNAVGNCLGISKLKMPSQDAVNKEWIEYCMQDVKIIEQAVTGLMKRWREEDCGVFQVTAPMLSLTNWKHTCEIRVGGRRKLDIVCMPGHYSHKMERESYYGGRVQCFAVGKFNGTFHKLDVNSLYPAMMHEYNFPRRLVRDSDHVTHRELDAALKFFGLVARVRINSRIDTYPLRRNGVILHANGVFDTTLCGPELERALHSGNIERIYGAQFYSVAPLFREWVYKWYARKTDAKLRGDAGKPDYEFAKMMLNTLSGKFAQSGKQWLTVGNRIPLSRWGPYFEHNPETGTIEHWRGVAGIAQKQETQQEPAFSLPLISAYICSYAREFMRDVIENVGIEHVYYMATDSIIVDDYGLYILELADMLDDYELGKFKHEGTYNEIELVSANHYRIGDDEVCAGMSGRAMRAKLKGEPLEVWEQATSIIRNGPRNDVVVSETIAPFIKPDYRGTIDSTGRWHPLRLSLDQDFADPVPLPQDVVRTFLDKAGVHRNLL